MANSFKTTPSGSIQVSDAGGNVIGTGSADFAAAYGYNSQPTAAPTPAPTPTPTPDASGATSRYPSGYVAPTTGPEPSAPAESAEDTAEAQYQSDATAEDPNAIATRISSEYASEIQSIKNYYAGLTSQQQTVNTNESGKTRALESASGELGQDIGNTETNQQDQANEQSLNVIGQEEQNAEGAVEGMEASTTESEIQSEKTAQQTADTQRLSFLSQQAQQAQSQIATVAGTTDLSSLPQDEYDSLYEASGFSTPEQFNTYYTAVRQGSILGAKTIGDATTGVYQQQADGTYKKIIPGTTNTIGDPTTGVWSLQSDGTYKNVIPAAPKVGSIGASGSYVFNSSTGAIQTVAPAANKIVSSGGVIYSVNPSTQQATPLTTTQNGWVGAKGASGDQEKAAIIGYVNSLGGGIDPAATIAKIQSDPTTYYQALSAATQAGYYVPVNLGVGTDSTDETDASTNADIDSQGSDPSSSQ